MAKVTLVLATIATALPAGVSFSGKYLFTIDGGEARIAETTTADFENIADGSYTASVQSLDSTGAPMNDKVTCSFSVSTPASDTPPAPSPAPAPDTGTYPAPSSLSATVAY